MVTGVESAAASDCSTARKATTKPTGKHHFVFTAYPPPSFRQWLSARLRCEEQHASADQEQATKKQHRLWQGQMQGVSLQKTKSETQQGGQCFVHARDENLAFKNS